MMDLTSVATVVFVFVLGVLAGFFGAWLASQILFVHEWVDENGRPVKPDTDGAIEILRGRVYSDMGEDESVVINLEQAKNAGNGSISRDVSFETAFRVMRGEEVEFLRRREKYQQHSGRI